MSKNSVSTNKAPAAIGPYSQGGVMVGDMLYTSGQLPIDMLSGNMPDSIEEQTKAALTNVKAIVEEAGMSMSDVFKVMIFLDDISEFTRMNDVYKTFFVEPYPSRSCVEVAKIPKGGAKIEIEAIAKK